MRNKIISLAFVLLFSAIHASAQNYTGTVLDENKQPFPYVNVMLLQPDSTTIVTGNITNNDGSYQLKSDLQGLLLKVSFIGYKTRIQKAQAIPQTIELEPDAKLLSEVVVKATRKIYEVKAGSITADVQNSLLATLPTTNDLIAELPFVAALGTLGKGESLIYINGRQVRDRNELERLSPKNIKSVEVVTTPGAEYDATVGLVLKITTLRPADEGLSGSIYAKAGTGKHFFGNEYISLNYRHGKWDFFGGFSFEHIKKQTTNESFQHFSNNTTYFEQTYNVSGITNNRNLIPEVGFNFTPTDKTALGLRYTGERKANKAESENQMISKMDKTTSHQDILLGNQKGNSIRHLFNGYFSQVINKKLLVFINSDMVLGNSTNDDENQSSAESSKQITTHSERIYKLYYIKNLFKYKLTATSTLNMGGEYTYTLNDQKYRVIETMNSGLKDESNNTRQHRTGMFILYEKSWNNIYLRSGLRYENIHLNYYNNNALDKDASKVYNKLFPNISISYTNKEKDWASSLSYEEKIKYPSYHDLRNSISYSTPFFYESGNPKILPETSHNLTAITAWKKWQCMVEYSFLRNQIIRNVSQYDQKADVLMFQPENIPTGQSFQAMLGYAPVLGIWHPRFEAVVMKQWLKLSDTGLSFNKPLYLLRWNNVFRFGKGWIARFNASYMSSDGNIDYFTTKTRFVAEARISKYLLNNKLQIEVAANDIFNSYRESGITDLGKYYLSIYKKMDTQQLALTVTYRFNPVKSKYKGETTNDEISRF